MWNFTMINGRLAEIYYDKSNDEIKFRGHCYVKKSEYKTKSEQRWIKKDTEKFKLTYQRGKYKQILVLN